MQAKDKTRRPSPKRPAKKSAPTIQAELTIDALGARGDGISLTPRAFVPFTLEGERVRARLGERRGDGQVGELIEILEASPERVAAACPHFGVCGGCALQHLHSEPYGAWKRDQVQVALAHHGLGAVPVEECVRTPPGARRRVDFVALALTGRVVAGYHARGSHQVVDVQACPILHPHLAALLEPFRRVVGKLLTSGERAGLAVNLTEAGADAVLEMARSPDLNALRLLTEFAETEDLARLSWRASAEAGPEPLLVRRKPVMRWGGVSVDVPPGAFLQASSEGEAALIALAVGALGNCRRIADLFAGSGTFSVALAGQAEVHAVEGAAAAAAALKAAAGRASLVRLSVETRDLARRPLSAVELARFDGALFDPPRAGAREQAAELAASGVGVVVAISCNPATFARDAALLVAGGYRLERVMPVDQFLWSPHVELAAVFRR